MPAERLERTFRWLRAVVIVAGALLGGYGGRMAGYLYSEATFGPESLVALAVIVAGTTSGLLIGVGAGWLWSYGQAWVTRASPGRTSPALLRTGVCLGGLVGATATAVLHLTMTAIVWQWDSLLGFILFWQFIGIPVGLGFGLIFGFVWWLACYCTSGGSCEEAARRPAGGQ